jgi:hypothetical protein
LLDSQVSTFKKSIFLVLSKLDSKNFAKVITVYILFFFNQIIIVLYNDLIKISFKYWTLPKKLYTTLILEIKG